MQQPAGRQSCAEEGSQIPCSRWSLIRTNFEEATAASMGKELVSSGTMCVVHVQGVRAESHVQ